MNYTEIEMEWMKEILRDKEEYIKKLEEDRDFFKEQATLWRNDYKKEYEKNKKLKAELEEADKAKMNALNWMSDLSSFWLEQVNKLEERIRFLEQCLDNKEKVNKSLREELEWYQWFDNYLTNHWFDMKNLKKNLSQYEN